MKQTAFRMLLPLTKIQKHHIQFALVIMTVFLLVLGAGAPIDTGGIGH